MSMKYLFIVFLCYAQNLKATEIPQGMNVWQAVLWALPNDQGGDRERLERELSILKQKNIHLLRIMASTQGSEDKSLAYGRMLPSCEVRAGEWREVCQEALGHLLNRIMHYEMQAIVVISNFWHWSGGFAQYQAWARGEEEIAYAFGATSSYWRMKNFFTAAADFYEDAKAQSYYTNFLKQVVGKFKGHPAIHSWQLANEPTPKNSINFESLLYWAKQSVSDIRQIDSSAKVSLGGVGEGPLPFWTFTDMKRLHQEVSFDYMTVHLWPQNWGWYFPRPEWAAKLSWPVMKWLSERYLKRHAELARELKLPMILEEVGLARDGESLGVEATTSRREAYFKFIREILASEAKAGTKILGIAYWAWGGTGRPTSGKVQWEPGDSFVGDPPQEPQGWYSIFETDSF
jgi:mannan endo-1,4-beta-mannosidase